MQGDLAEAERLFKKSVILDSENPRTRLAFAIALANKGYRKALIDDANLCEGLNVHLGQVTYKAVADVLGYAYQPARIAIGC